MHIAALAVRNVARNKLRTALTILGVAVAILAFVLLRTVLSAWTSGVNHAAKDRIGTRHKVSMIMPLPIKYVQEIRETPGVKNAALASWFGGKHPTRESEFFATIAVDAKTFLDVFDEVKVPPDQVERWMANRRGALIGDNLAKKFGWKVGQKVRLTGTIYPGDWEFEISGVYTSLRPTVDRATFWFHWDYLNESVDQRSKDLVGWVVSRIDDPSRAADISKTIDAHFEERDTQTLSMSERALNTSFLGMISAILKAVDVISIVILLIMVLILGNTIAMGVRERTHEYGVLRAIGFLPRHIVTFVIGEAITVGVLGGVVGLLISYPIVEQGFGRFLEENMSGFFPYFRIEAPTLVAALVLSLLLGAVGAILPAYRASKLDVVDSLRRVG
jgi:putative ABC transport system permease protein